MPTALDSIPRSAGEVNIVPHDHNFCAHAGYIAEFHLPLPTTPDNQFKFPYNVQITPGSMDPTDFRTVKKSIEIFSAQLRPIIKTFLNNPRLRTWAPPTDACEEIQRFYRGLGIPEVPVPGNETKPSLLFHNLGNRSNTNEDKLFAKGKDHR